MLTLVTKEADVKGCFRYTNTVRPCTPRRANVCNLDSLSHIPRIFARNVTRAQLSAVQLLNSDVKYTKSEELFFLMELMS